MPFRAQALAAAAAALLLPAVVAPPADASASSGLDSQAQRIQAVATLLGPQAAAAAADLLAGTADIDTGDTAAQPAAPATGGGRTVHAGAVTVDELRAAQQRAAAPPAPSAAPLPVGANNRPSGDGSPATAADPAVIRCPVDGPTRFTDTFGAPRSGGRSHEGTDMMAARGLPVVTLADAVVVRVNTTDTGLGGLTVSYVTADGARWYNAHLSALAPAAVVGAHLPSGTVIGYVGDTGDAHGTGTHLHIEFHPHGGAAVDAYVTLAAACGH